MNSPTPDAVARKIRPALTKLYVMYFRVAHQSNLTGPQLSIMTRMKENGESRISQLAKEEGIRMPTASNALHQLEQRGMVERIRDTHDRRGVRVHLTELGMAELERVGEERTRNLTEMLEELSPEELRRTDEFVDVINILASKYGAEDPTR
ncbi:MarR family transcriptional regulator [Corynebacterium sp. zg-331]|uniref:MarR family winged helix-turn-helix transcriptional regulator n=1 Tax=unclassified Corynebacterium TaxID=2624378 RepID=UPI00128E1964|nr:MULTISPECIES: MarR family transcriptional regulator [unclassified Corynebacterium]MBC3186535.1 MarR family transcriptional regulator [Corynebacterium sp. zg-331]MPV53018.1 MarR family transcriptional regulator [Corynebacterium sp. zg331]